MMKYISLNTIKSQLIFYAGMTVGLLLITIIAVFLYRMYPNLVNNTERLIFAHTQEIAEKIETSNLEAITISKTMAQAQESGLFGNRKASSLFARNVLTQNPKLTGAYFAYEPNADQDDQAYLEKAGDDEKRGLDKKGRFLPYWFIDHKDHNKVKLTPEIDMETSLYYQGCKDKYLSGSPEKYMITEPYFYEGKMLIEQTYPIKMDGHFVGIAGVDRAITDIHQFLESFQPYETAGFVLISQKGRIISSTIDLVSSEQFKQLQYKMRTEEKDTDVTQIDQKMMTRSIEETDYQELLDSFYRHSGSPILVEQADPLEGQTYLFSVAKIQTGDWTIVMRVAKSEMTKSIWRTVINVISIAIIGLFITFMSLFWMAKKISKPITRVVAISKQVADGDLTAQIVVKSSDEMGRLLSAFKTMIDNLNTLVTVHK